MLFGSERKQFADIEGQGNQRKIA